MTMTYNDIEAVSRLLEEKERDLELAAQIGQSLLENKKCLDKKNNKLEEFILEANERINQLKHDLMMKDELLQLYVQNYEGTDVYSPDSSEKLMVPEWQEKIKRLEEKNEYLRLETANLKLVVDGLEDKEQKLISDCDQKMAVLQQQRDRVVKELTKKTEECSQHKDEITTLFCQIDIIKKQIHYIMSENTEYKKSLQACDDTQNCLEKEITELMKKNEEIRLQLEKAQEELRYLQHMERPHATLHSFAPFLSVPGESLASELENSLHRDKDYPNGSSPEKKKKHTWKVFKTAKAVNSHRDGSLCSASMLHTSGLETEESKSVSPRSSLYYSDAESCVSERFGGDIESWYGGSTRRYGMPGIPGSNDLRNALRRLTLRQEGEQNQHCFVPEENAAARQEQENRIPHQTVNDMTCVSDTESCTCHQCHSRDSMLSANSGYISMTGSPGNPHYQMHERLEIIKLLEGSGTLKRWQDLAKPHMGVIFEANPGVHNKGEQTLDIVHEVCSFSDYEEDDDISISLHQYQESATVFAPTESTVGHLAEATRVTTSSFMTSTPRMILSDRYSHRQATQTYSISPELTPVHNEWDIVQTLPEEASAPARSIHSSSPVRFPCLVHKTNTTASESLSSSLLLTCPTNLFQQTPPTVSTLPQRLGHGPLSGLQTDIPLPGEQTLVGAQGSESSDFLQNGSPSLKKCTTVKVESNVIRNLKERGSSLFGYLISSAGVYTSGSDAEVSQPCVIMVSATSTTSVSNVTTFVSSTNSMATTAINTDGVTAMSTTPSEMPKHSHLASILSRKSVGGILGAFSKLTRDGAL